MAISVAMRFMHGRFHATPWGHHVNEALVEWPPSPWRLLRALVAVSRRKLPGERLIERELPGLLAQLAKEQPEFHLPPVTVGHTRHYMPWFKKGPQDKTLVFDAFVSIDPEKEVVFHWPGALLAPDAAQALNLLLAHLSYFGRAESWVVARLLSKFDRSLVNCRPSLAQPAEQSVRVLLPDPVKWNAWDFTDAKIPHPDPPWNLLAETADMQRERWSNPPGSKWVCYSRPADSLAARAGPKLTPLANSKAYTVARYALDGPKGRQPLPLVTQTLPLAEQVRRSLIALCKAIVRRHQPSLTDAQIWPLCPAFWGKDGQGQPLLGHQHAFFLPADEDQDGRLDHLTVFAPMGFNDQEFQALYNLRRLPLTNGEYMPLLLIGLGNQHDFRAPVLGRSAVWISATPFVVTRYPKLRGTKRDRPEAYASPRAFARQVLQQELARRTDLPQMVSLDVEEFIGARRLRPIQFQRFRRKRADDGGRRPAAGFRLTFAAPVQGPLCLGHSCHFGLGLFLPAALLHPSSREARW